jgi:hypothetical protein
MHLKFRLESLKGRDHSEDLDVCKRIILEWILGKCGLADWIHMSQNRDQWWALVNTLMNLQVP